MGGESQRTSRRRENDDEIEGDVPRPVADDETEHRSEDCLIEWQLGSETERGWKVREGRD